MNSNPPLTLIFFLSSAVLRDIAPDMCVLKL
jgi:hypothetical protein